MTRFTLHTGDSLHVMQELEPDSIDSIVTDPPYGLSFMGKGWDHGVPGVEFWVEALRVAKPGAHLLAFGGTRTFHRLTVAIEDAGWEIRDCVMWVYGSGFPKSLDVSKAIDKAAGAEREVVKGGGRSNIGTGARSSGRSVFSQVLVDPSNAGTVRNDITIPATDAARQWSGWGTALKPAWEPIIVARKPLCGTVAENVLRYGTGAMNIDASRIGGTGGRWPANLIHDGSDEVTRLFPQSTSKQTEFNVKGRTGGIMGTNGADRNYVGGFDDSGSAARFFYAAKASRNDRDEGNTHPTVKPTDLMRYLCRLITQPNGLILDPFMGSGSTGKAAILEGYRFIGVDLDPEYVQIAHARITHAQNTQPLFM